VIKIAMDFENKLAEIKQVNMLYKSKYILTWVLWALRNCST